MTHLPYHLEIIGQIRDALVLLNPMDYEKKLKVLQNNSLGQHFRHILEFYQCLLDGLDTGIVNYDARRRDLHLETNLSYAIHFVESMANRIQDIPDTTSIGLECTLGNCSGILPSTVSRELLYLTEHTVHHFAIIKIGMTEACPSISPSENFGVADSTVRHAQVKE